MSDIKRYDVDINWSREDWCLEEFEVGDVVKYEDHAAIVAQLEQELAKVTARYNCVRDMTPEDFGNLSSINDDFDSQVDAMIKAQQDHIPNAGKMVEVSEHGEGQENDCPECGAEAGSSCSSDEGIEYGRRVHEVRQSQAKQDQLRDTTKMMKGCKECDGQTYMHSPTVEYLGECPYCTKEQDPYAYDVPTEDGTELAYAGYYGKYKNKLPEGAIPLYLKSQAQEPESKWISVDERLPEGYKPVLVVTNFGDVYTCRLPVIIAKNSKEESVGRRERFTHWMPLPPAPEYQDTCTDGGKCGAGGYCKDCIQEPTKDE